MIDRRKFIKASISVSAASVAATTTSVSQAEGEKLKLDDPLALALGYVEDTTKVDKAKYPTHQDDQVCVGCALYVGDDPDWGGCGAFPGKLVAGQGWCQAYVAKS